MHKSARCLTLALILTLFNLAFFSANIQVRAEDSEVTRLLNEGITYHSNRNYLLAIKSFEKALGLEPTNKQILTNLSIAHNNYGKYLAERTDGTGAAREFRTALYYNPQNTVARANLEFKMKDLAQSGDDYVKRIVQAKQERLNENFFASIAELREANRLKETADAYLEIGTNYYLLALKSPQSDDYVASAIDAFNKAIMLAPNDARPYIKLGDVHVAVGKINQGIDYYEKAIKIDPSSKDAQTSLINGWLAAIRIAPYLANNHVGLGTAYQLRGDFMQAERSFRRALEIDPNSLLAQRGLGSLQEDRIRTQVNLFLDRAVASQKQGDFDQSLANYIKALNLEPTNPDIHYNIGTAFQAKGDTARAEKAYRKAIELKADHVEAKQALLSLQADAKEALVAQAFAEAVKFQKAGNYAEAIKIYNRIAVDKPGDDSLFYNLAVAYQATGDLDKSTENYKRAYAIKPDSTYSEAIRSVEIAKANSLLAKAIELQSKASNTEAIKLYEQVVVLVPDNANAWYNLGTAYQATGNDSRALNAYQKAYGLDAANQTEAMFFAAMILEDQRQLMQAISLYDKYLSIAPTGDYASEAKSRKDYIKSFL